METRRAFCSACDRNVPVMLLPREEKSAGPSLYDPGMLVCLDYGVRCTGSMCPLFSYLEKGIDPPGAGPTGTGPGRGRGDYRGPRTTPRRPAPQPNP